MKGGTRVFGYGVSRGLREVPMAVKLPKCDVEADSLSGAVNRRGWKIVEACNSFHGIMGVEEMASDLPYSSL